MPLGAGSRVGPFEIIAVLGKGGMGEVYRASDPRLRREVAIKVLPPEFSAEPDRLRRLEQEAMATAALNHPNILVIYDIGAIEGAPYVVSELLTGRTLREEMAEAGSLSLRHSLDYARQIARGLAAAHARGIVHRDLKPENLFVTTDGQIKILDFGLAKLIEPAITHDAVTSGPTVEHGTQPGMVLGTVGYMSPEQVRGQAADHRADIFSFGAVLYEMLYGQRPFRGTTHADTITSLLKDDPSIPFAAERPVPQSLARLVLRCLEKAPERRFQSASDLAFALDQLSNDSDLASDPTRVLEPPPARRRGAWSIAMWAAAMLVVGLIGVATSLSQGARDSVATTDVLRFTIPSGGLVFGTGAGTGARDSIDIAPDGRHLAFIGQTAAATAVWVRPLNAVQARRLPGTDGAVGRVFWSADSKSIAFLAGGSLKQVNVATSAVRVITDVTTSSPSSDGTWNSSGTIVFGLGRGSGLFQVRAEGGAASAVTTLDQTRGEVGHYLPQFLADGRQFVYVVQSPNQEVAGIYLSSLDRRQTTRLLDVVSPIAVSSSGYLLFIQNQAVMAQLLDPATGQLGGTPQALADETQPTRGVNPLGVPLAVSQTGLLVRSEPSNSEQQFMWVDRNGLEKGLAGEPGRLGNFDLSPDEKQLAFSQQEEGRSSIWTLDLMRGVATRMTAQGRNDSSPVWSPDGRRIAFSRQASLGPQIVVMQATGGGETPLTDSNILTPQVDDWSPDGRVISYNSDPALLTVPADGGKPTAFVQTDGKNVDESHFSNDGKWVAYNSNDSGNWQVYVAPFPPTGQRWQVSANGGVEGRWRGDGGELYFLSLDGEMMAVDVRLSNGFEAGAPRRMFDARININARADHYAVSRDGHRFLIKRPVGRAERDPWTVIVNWPALLVAPERR